MDSSTCMELALEGERLCKSGDFNGGVAFFEAAVKVGTADMKTLSAIYSQLGNAYFYLSNYQKAMDYHKLDLTVARSISDRIGEAKASGNLGNTLKMMARYDEAIMCCKRHLDISKELGDKIGEGRALYNLGNVYHTKGKGMARMGREDPGEFPEEVRSCLEQAVDYYKQNLELMLQLGDKSAQGRAYGNLGNTYYLLGNFTEAVAYHEQRLQIAGEFNDKAAERRAHCNLGNAHIFLGEFEKAVEDYKHTLQLAQELNDRVVEAQACYSLGNTYTLLRDYKTAIEYHLRHLQIAQELRDRIGEGRACWSLGNALTAIGDHHEALGYAQKHFEISKEIGDITGQTTAQMSITDLRKLLENDPKANAKIQNENTPHTVSSRPKRLSMEHLEIMKLTPEQRQQTLQTVDEGTCSNTELNNIIHNEGNEEMGATGISKSHEDFLDMLSKFQSKRMDDQRCALNFTDNKENRKPIERNVPRMGTMTNHNPRNPPVRSMSHDTVRARNYGNSNPAYGNVNVNPAFGNVNPNPGFGNVNPNPGFGNPNAVHNNPNNLNHNNPNAIRHNNSHAHSNHIGNVGSASPPSQGSPNEQFREELFDLIEGMNQRRMDDQRASLPPIRRNSATNGPESLPPRNRIVNFGPNNHNNNAPHMRVVNPRPHPSARQMSLGANVLPDDDFFEMLMRCQSTRLEDQRALIPGTSEDTSESRPTTLERPLSGNATQDNSPCQFAPTVPDEDFFSLILRFQAGRIEDQRSALPDRSQSLQSQPEDEHMKGSSASSRKSSTASTKSGTGSNASSARRSKHL